MEPLCWHSRMNGLRLIDAHTCKSLLLLPELPHKRTASLLPPLLRMAMLYQLLLHTAGQAA
jgi:hypothetical protein